MPHPDLLPDEGRRHPSRTLVILVGGAIAYSLAQTIIIPALPAIQRDTGVSEATGAWLVTAFLLTASVSTPLLGRLGDMFGKERTLLAALLLFAAGSAICAVGSHSIEALIAGRLVQGAGGAIFPLSFGIIRDELPRERVAKSIGIVSSTFGVGSAAGLVLAGLVVDRAGVRLLFCASLTVTCVAAWATWRYIPESPVRTPARIDWGGGAVLSAALVSTLLGFTLAPDWGWSSAGVLGLLAGGAVLLAAFLVHEARVPEPLVALEMLGRRAVYGANMAAFAVGFAMFGSYILIPQLVQAPTSTGYGFGHGTTEAALVMLPSSILMLVAGAAAGWLGQRCGSRLPLAIGAVICAATYAGLALAHAQLWMLVAGAALLGVGVSFALAAMANLVVVAVDQTQTGIATGINTILRNVGGAVGGQIAASLLASRLLPSGAPAESGYSIAFTMSSVAALIALATCLLIPRTSVRSSGSGDAASPARATA